MLGCPHVGEDMLLQFLDKDREIYCVELENGALHIGRSSSNDIILQHSGVSGHHAMVFVDAGTVKIRDNGSTNGTFVNDARVYHEKELTQTDTVRFGSHVHMRIASTHTTQPQWVLSHADTDGLLAIPLRELTKIPSSEACLCYSNQEITLIERDGAERTIKPGHRFDLNGNSWIIRRADTTLQTERATSDVFPYSLLVELHRPLAVLSHRAAQIEIVSAPGVAMLHVLAEAGLAAQQGAGEGWCDDAALGVAIWGRAWKTQAPNSLNVVIHRVRKKVTQAGLEKWFIERRPGQTRLRVRHITVRGDGAA